MDLTLTDSQEMLKQAARSFIQREGPKDLIVSLEQAGSALVPDLWRKACELGWLGLLIPAEHGGQESSLSDAAVLYEEMGRGPLPGPFFSSGVLGALLLLEGGTPEQRRAILPGVASGERILGVAITDPSMSWGAHGVTVPT